MFHGFEDMEDDLGGDNIVPQPKDYLDAAAQYARSQTGSQKTYGAAKAAHAPTDRAEKLYSEDCPACKGTGRFKSYTGRDVGSCFKCNGKGVLTFKTSPESRASSRNSAERIRIQKAMEISDNVAGFEQQSPEIIKWFADNPNFEFAQSLKEQLYRKGELSDGQMAAINKCLARDAERQAQRAAEAAQRVADAPVVNMAKLEECFARVLAAGNQRVTLTFSGVTFSPAKANSANPGAIYVKERHSGAYLGKVMNNKFLSTRECTEENVAFVADVLNDPRAAAIKHGKLTGACCVCNRLLTNDDSIELGIGPICAEKMGW
jgi:hypothetical protein